MPFLQDHPRYRGITLPPSGWVLAALLAIYIFAGLIGHDPWKHDDALTIGVVHDMVRHGHWLATQLAGQAYPAAPFYYWTAAAMAHLFGWLLPLHDAARLASGLYTLLALQFILLAARELYGRDYAAAAPLALAGSIGFLYHAHEAQPMLAALAAHTAAYWALSLMRRQPRRATLTFGLAAAIGLLANGLLPLLALLPATLLSIALAEQRWPQARRVLFGLALAGLLAGAWAVALQAAAPGYLAALLHGESEALTQPLAILDNCVRYLGLLLWYAWPALPLAAWSLWAKRQSLRTLAWPLSALLGVLLILGLSVELSSAAALLLLPPLVLVATAGVASLRRGAANAFDWFAMTTFTFFAAICWIVWSALVFGWPERMARQAVRLEPGFVGQFSLPAFVLTLVLTLVWLWMIATSPRSPMRGLMHWMAGLTLFWVLIAALWMPWINYGKTYASVARGLAGALPAKAGCLANVNLPDSVLATLDYFVGVRTVPLASAAGQRCRWLVEHGAPGPSPELAAAGWREVWEGRRPSDRGENEGIHLYRREKPFP